MNNRAKKIFLALSIIVPFLMYSVYYYSMVLKNAPYKFTEFESFTFQYGQGDSLLNKFNSKTGDYQYLNTRDSVVKMNVHLKKDELLYLHHKASELGFWDFPANETGDTANAKLAKPVRYLISFYYKRKYKKVIFDSDFNGDPKLKDANEQFIKQIQQVLNDAEARQKK